MTEVSYVALIHKDPDSEYGISFPDFPGCVSAGRTLEDAIGNGREALLFHIEGMIEDQEDIPRPSPIEAILSTSSDHLAIVPISVPETQETIRINITVGARDLAVIDSAARLSGLSRSAFLVGAALERGRKKTGQSIL